jgi:Fe2+ or Zn2+ uptake regulation protein
MNPTEVITQRLRAQGLRLTPQKRVVIGLLQNNTAHPTVDSLYENARQEVPSISRRTVYQTVNDLESMGEVTLLDLGTGSVRVDPNVEHPHHHMICSECGVVRDAVIDVSALTPSARDRRDFDVTDVEVNFRGVCRICQDNGKTA